LLRGCDVVAFTEPDAHATGRLLNRSKANDIFGAAVVVLAVAHSAEIVTSDRDDIAHLLAAARATWEIIEA
jgi:hypothetical protein